MLAYAAKILLLLRVAFRPRHSGGLSFGTFSLAAQRKGTLHQEKPNEKRRQIYFNIGND
jgi:hypothetical protein